MLLVNAFFSISEIYFLISYTYFLLTNYYVSLAGLRGNGANILGKISDGQLIRVISYYKLAKIFILILSI